MPFLQCKAFGNQLIQILMGRVLFTSCFLCAMIRGLFLALFLGVDFGRSFDGFVGTQIFGGSFWAVEDLEGVFLWVKLFGSFLGKLGFFVENF
jgi:hypothetical protein